jgi:hypothetical protein
VMSIQVLPIANSMVYVFKPYTLLISIFQFPMLFLFFLYCFLLFCANPLPVSFFFFCLHVGPISSSVLFPLFLFLTSLAISGNICFSTHLQRGHCLGVLLASELSPLP